MITVQYRGQMGNNITQYCYGRIVAEITGQSFRAPGIRLFPQLETAIDGKDYGYGEITIEHTSSHHVIMSPQETADRIRGFDAILKGYFERAEWYLPHREKIKRWFGAWPVTLLNTGGIHVRGKDGEWNSPPLDYYLAAAIKVRDIGGCHLFTDDPHCGIVLELLRRAAVKGCANTPTDNDFGTMMRCSTLIIGNSTFAWWAAFLSNASRVIQPEPLKGFRSKELPNSYLRVPGWEQIEY